MDNLITYSLTLFFFFFLLNYAEISKKPANWLKGFLGPVLGYPLRCSLCFAFWTTLVLWWLGKVPGTFVFIVPVVHLFVDSLYSRLNPEPPFLLVGTPVNNSFTIDTETRP